MLVNAQLESAMGTQAGNGGGPFQFMPQTAKQYGLTNTQDQAANIDAGARFTADNIKGLTKALGQTPDVYQERMAHWFGTGGATKLIGANDDSTVSNLIGIHGEDLAKNGLTESTTVGQLKANVKTAVDGALAQVSGHAAAPLPGQPPDFSAMPSFMKDYIGLHPGAYDSMLSHANAILQKHDTAAKIDLEGQVSNFNAAVLRGENAPRPSDQQIIATMGPRAPALIAELNTNQRYGAAYGQLKALPAAQMQATIDAWKPTDSSTAVERQRYDDLNTQAQRIQVQRHNQPLETAAASGVYDLKPLDFTDMTKVGDQLAARNQVAGKISQDYGTPFVNLTDDETKAISGFVKGAPVAQVAQLFQQVRKGSSDPGQYLATMAKIAPEHQVPAVAGAIMLKQNPIDLGASH